MKKYFVFSIFYFMTLVSIMSQAVEVLSLINRNGLNLLSTQEAYFSSTEFDTTYLGYEGLELQVSSVEFLHDVYLDIEELGQINPALVKLI